MKKAVLFIIALLPIFVWSQSSLNTEKVQKILDNSVDNKNVFGVTVTISKDGHRTSLASGNINNSDQYFLASVTKLYTTAIIFQLSDQGKLNLNDPIKNHLPSEYLSGLHTYKGKDYANHITIGHLVSQTSGLPDYFEQENASGESIRDFLLNKGDTALSIDQILEITKSLPPHFPPGENGKAYYSDGNFQLLGQIIESITGKPLKEAYQEYIFNKLQLKSTYLFSDISSPLPSPIYYKDEAMHIPKMMVSFGPDGGMVSTSAENMLFLEAFFAGKLFAKSNLEINGSWNKIYSPFQYGKGLMKFKFPGMPELIGHAGASGSFCYYVPARDVYITGTINQIDKPQLGYKLIAKILNAIK